MKKIPIADVLGVYVFELDRFDDDRGFFQPTYHRSFYFEEMPSVLQTQISSSKKNVIRGLHVAPYSKICTCLQGSLFDVVADVRKSSPTYGQWFGLWLTPNNLKQLFIPAGCAHGFFSSEENTILMYAQDGLWNPAFEYEIHWQDPTLAISWPESDNYVLSEKDLKANFLESI